MISDKELYELCVEVKNKGIISKTMQTAGDIYYLRYYCGLIDGLTDTDENIKNNRFVFYIILHHLWTPSRMKYFYENYINYSNDNQYSFKDILLKSLYKIDDKQRLTVLDKYENKSFRSGRIAGFTCEKKCIDIVEDWDNLNITAKELEKQWNDEYKFDKLTKIAKQIKWYGSYFAAHLIRSLTYSIKIPEKNTITIDNWNTLGKMSEGVTDMVKQLGLYATDSPAQFIINLKRDTGCDNIDIGDAALILCEIKGAKLTNKDVYDVYRAKMVNFTKEDIITRRYAEMRKYGLPEDDSITYLSIQRMLACL